MWRMVVLVLTLAACNAPRAFSRNARTWVAVDGSVVKVLGDQALATRVLA